MCEQVGYDSEEHDRALTQMLIGNSRREVRLATTVRANQDKPAIGERITEFYMRIKYRLKATCLRQFEIHVKFLD